MYIYAIQCHYIHIHVCAHVIVIMNNISSTKTILSKFIVTLHNVHTCRHVCGTSARLCLCQSVEFYTHTHIVQSEILELYVKVQASMSEKG